MKRNIFSVIGLLFFLFFLIVLHLHHPLPVYDGDKMLPGLKDPVDVYTDPYGVPHIIAQNEKDLFYWSIDGQMKVKTYTDWSLLESEIVFVQK